MSFTCLESTTSCTRVPRLTVNQSFSLLKDDLLALGDGDVFLLGGKDGRQGGLALQL